MTKMEQIEFLKQYFEIFKTKDGKDVVTRFLKQVDFLVKSNEIDEEIGKIITNCVEIGNIIGEPLNPDNVNVIKTFIGIGVECNKIETNAISKRKIIKPTPSSSSSCSVSRSGC